MNANMEWNDIKNSKGFTLLEVIVVVAIIGIAAAIAIPNIISWVPNYQLKGAARDLYSHMQKARSEAVKRNTDIGISFSTVVYPATGGSYQVFIDDGSGGGIASNAIQDGTEIVLNQVIIPASCSLVSSVFSGNPRTGYNARGLPLGNRTGSATLRNNRSRWYKMSLSNAGYTKIERSSDGSTWE